MEIRSSAALALSAAMAILSAAFCGSAAEAQWSDAGTYVYATDAPNVVVTDSGRLGVGTASPLSPLHVVGELRLDLGEGLLFYSNPDFWGTGQDSRNLRLIDGNSSQASVDGGLVIETYTSQDNFRLPLMTVRHNATDKTYFGFGALYPQHLFSLNSTWTLGAGKVDVSGADVYGTGTAFLSTIEPGSEVLIAGAVRRVSEVLSDTHLRVANSFVGSNTQANHRYNRPLFSITEAGQTTIGTSFGGAGLDVYGPLEIGGNEVIDADGNWTGPESWVDLTSDQTVFGKKTFDDLIVADGGLTVLGNLQIGDRYQGRQLDLYTSYAAINFYAENGTRFGQIFTNPSGDFVLAAPNVNGRFRIARDLHLRHSDSGSYQNLYTGAVFASSKLALTDSGGDTVGQFWLSGPDTVFAADMGSTLRIDTNLRVHDHLQVDEGLHVENGLDLIGNLILHPLRTGSSTGQVCYENISGSGDVLIKCSSSERFKENILPLESGMSVVEKLRPVSYTWKENGQRDLGFVAEEVAQIEPRLAAISGGVVDGVRYDKMTAVLVNALQEQQAEIARQRAQIDELRELLCLNRKEAPACGALPVE